MGCCIELLHYKQQHKDRFKCATKDRMASSVCWETAAAPSPTSQLSAAVPEDLQEEEEDDKEYIEQLEEYVEELEKKLKTLKHERLLCEVEIRREVCTEMQQQFVQIDDTYNMLQKEIRQREVERFEKKLQLIMDYYQSSKRPFLVFPQPSSSKDVMVDNKDKLVSSLKVQEREAELRSRVSELQFQVADLTRRNKVQTARADKAEEAQQQLEKAAEDSNSVLVESLSRQLQEVKDSLKEKEEEVDELTDMLVDAEAFQQEEHEIVKLMHLIFQYEVVKAEDQIEMIQQLLAQLQKSNASVDSEQSLEAKDLSITHVKDTPSHLQHTDTLSPSPPSRPTPPQSMPVMTVTPLCSNRAGRSESDQSPDIGLGCLRHGSVESVGEKMPDVQSPVLILDTPTPPPPVLCSQIRRLPFLRGSCDQGKPGKPSTLEVIISKAEENRVTPVVVTPIKKPMTRQTKNRLTSPAQPPANGKKNPARKAKKQ